MNIEIVESKLFPGAVADEIAQVLSDAVDERGSASLVLAGGSTPASVYRALGLPPRVEQVPWSSLRVYLGDERWVPEGDPLSNFRMANETLFQKLLGHQAGGPGGIVVSPVDTSLRTPLDGARAYEQLIQAQEGLVAGQLPEFDLVLLGMGEDGHTASLFPHSTLSGGPIVGVATHPGDGDKPGGVRVSLTAAAIKNARRIIFMVTGDSKAAMLKRVLETDASEQELPARLAATARGSVTWFLDTGASAQLSKQEHRAS